MVIELLIKWWFFHKLTGISIEDRAEHFFGKPLGGEASRSDFLEADFDTSQHDFLADGVEIDFSSDVKRGARIFSFFFFIVIVAHLG